VVCGVWCVARGVVVRGQAAASRGTAHSTRCPARGAQRVVPSAWCPARGAQRVVPSAWCPARGAQRRHSCCPAPARQAAGARPPAHLRVARVYAQRLHQLDAQLAQRGAAGDAQRAAPLARAARLALARARHERPRQVLGLRAAGEASRPRGQAQAGAAGACSTRLARGRCQAASGGMQAPAAEPSQPASPQPPAAHPDQLHHHLLVAVAQPRRLLSLLQARDAGRAQLRRVDQAQIEGRRGVAALGAQRQPGGRAARVHRRLAVPLVGPRVGAAAVGVCCSGSSGCCRCCSGSLLRRRRQQGLDALPRGLGGRQLRSLVQPVEVLRGRGKGRRVRARGERGPRSEGEGAPCGQRGGLTGATPCPRARTCRLAHSLSVTSVSACFSGASW
jgi:hypothetical protein